MNDSGKSKLIQISDFQKGTVQTTEYLHFTGGLLAVPVVGGGLVFGPVSATPEDSNFVGPMSFANACEVAKQAGCHYVGVNQVHVGNGPERCELWNPNLGASGTAQSSDSWAGIASRAEDQEDKEYADVARHLSLSLRSAGWRLREVSRLHYEQLLWALFSSRPSGSRFSNIPIFDLYLAVHSLVAEMCAARDYLAQIAVARVQAKPGTDSLARLCNWLDKSSNRSAKGDPLVTLLLGALGTEESPGWLTDLGEMRNRLLHRQPLAANPEAAALLFQIVPTSKGPVPTIRLSRFRRGEDVVDGADPFLILLRHWLELEKLSRSCVPLAKHPVVHPHFTA